MNLDQLLKQPVAPTPEEERVTRATHVRLTTSVWRSGDSIICQKKIRLLKRLSGEYHHLFEDADAAGVDEAWNMLKNVDRHPDGIYKLVMTNVRTDWETGCAEEWDLELVPVAQPK